MVQSTPLRTLKRPRPPSEWGSFLSIVDGSLNPILVSDLDQVVVKELMAENRGLTLPDLKKGSEYSSVTTTSGEWSDEQELPAVSTPLADADDRLSDIASVIPPVDPQMVTLKHSAFQRSCLWMRWTLVSPPMAGPMTTLYSPCRPQLALQVREAWLQHSTIPILSTTQNYRFTPQVYSTFPFFLVHLSPDFALPITLH